MRLVLVPLSFEGIQLTSPGCLEVHSVQRTFVAEARAFGVRQAPRLLHLQLEEQLPMEAREPPEMMAFHT